jgi:F-type H+-transporting ATPase subunit gamma
VNERLADIRAHVEGVRQLRQVFNALGGMAAARAQAARGQLVAADAYAGAIADAILHAPIPRARPPAPRADAPAGLVVFAAEQGFAGAFSERIFTALGDALTADDLFLVGTRGADLAAQRGVRPVWTSAAASHGAAAPRLADRIAEACLARIAAEKIARLDVAFASWTAGGGFKVERRRIFPLDPALFVRPDGGAPPLVQIAPDLLLRALAETYVHAELCRAALHSFAAENQARMEAMAAARRQAETRLERLQADERRVRQDEITAEIIELCAGDAAVVARRAP